MLYGYFGLQRKGNMLFGMTYLFWFFMLVIVAIALGLAVAIFEK